MRLFQSDGVEWLRSYQYNFQMLDNMRFAGHIHMRPAASKIASLKCKKNNDIHQSWKCSDLKKEGRHHNGARADRRCLITHLFMRPSTNVVQSVDLLFRRHFNCFRMTKIEWSIFELCVRKEKVGRVTKNYPKHDFLSPIVCECVAVAKLSKALAWLSCVRSRERPEF